MVGLSPCTETAPVSSRTRKHVKAVAIAPWASIYENDFFRWAGETSQRFDCAAGNPPFIRYQRWPGEVRQRALILCSQVGVSFSCSTSLRSLLFLVATASLLKPGGRMAFVVPAEIGHATYSAPLLQYLARSFGVVHIVAIRTKMFAALSEDCWLLYADGFGEGTDHFRITLRETFLGTDPVPHDFEHVSLSQWQAMRSRLRPFLLPAPIRSLYRELQEGPMTVRLGDVGALGSDTSPVTMISSICVRRRLPPRAFHRNSSILPWLNGRTLPEKAVTHATVRGWLNRDEPVLLLRIERVQAAVMSGSISARRERNGRNKPTSAGCETLGMSCLMFTFQTPFSPA